MFVGFLNNDCSQVRNILLQLHVVHSLIQTGMSIKNTKGTWKQNLEKRLNCETNGAATMTFCEAVVSY